MELAEIVTLYVPFSRIADFGTVQLGSQIQSDRLRLTVTDPPLKPKQFYIGNGSCYGVNPEGHVIFYLTDFENNLSAKDPVRAQEEWAKNHNFFVDTEAAKTLEERAASKNGVVAFDLTALAEEGKLQGTDAEYRFIEVSTEKLKEGRGSFEREYGSAIADIFDAAHGQAIYGENGIGALLSQEDKSGARIGATRIYILNPEYVKTKLAGKKGTLIARAAVLYSMNTGSWVSYVEVRPDYNSIRGALKASKTMQQKQ